MKLFLQPNGSVWAVGMESDDPDAIKQQVWSFFHHGAIESSKDFIELSDRFSYIWTDKERLEKYFLNSSYHKVLNEMPKQKVMTPFGVMENHSYREAKGLGMGAKIAHKIKKLARERMAELLENTDRWWRASASTDTYGLGVISAEKPDKDS
jgi:hypothetical protein